MIYKNEAAFSRSLSAKLKSMGLDVVRLESHNTANGIPDMFVQGHGYDFWLELKNGKCNWRPGQVAWAMNYYMLHNKSRCTLTLTATSSNILITPMTSVAPLSVAVPLEAWQKLQPMLPWLLRTITYINKCTVRDAAIDIAYQFDVDYCADAYFEQEELEEQASPYDKLNIILDCVELLKNKK